MLNSEDRFNGEDVGHADLAEVPRRARDSNIRKYIVAVGATIGMLLLAVILIRGSFPALTPEEIVQREDYEGQQPPRHIFNLYSLKQEKLRREPEASAAPLVVADGDQSNNSAIGTALQAEILTADKPYEESELSRDTILPVVSAASGNKLVLAAAKSDKASRIVTVLPVYTIKANQTNLRSQPSLDAPVLKTLNKGQALTVFESSGKWVQVATNDGIATTGFVHNSLLEIADIK